MKFATDSIIDFDIDVIMNAIHAIEKAVSEDVPRQLSENHLETNNYLAFIRGDFINSNLRELTTSGCGELLPFQRFGWRGRLLVDRLNRLTYSITTQANLHQIPRKHRQKPHFLQTLLAVENSDLEGYGRQLTLYDMDSFEQETYHADFDDIVNGFFDSSEGYRHCVITYQAQRDEVTDISLVLLDSKFAVVEEYSLNEFRRPDFSQLTVSASSDDAVEREVHNVATKSLTKLKKGIKPGLREIAEEA